MGEPGAILTQSQNFPSYSGRSFRAPLAGADRIWENGGLRCRQMGCSVGRLPVQAVNYPSASIVWRRFHVGIILTEVRWTIPVAPRRHASVILSAPWHGMRTAVGAMAHHAGVMWVLKVCSGQMEFGTRMSAMGITYLLSVVRFGRCSPS